MENTPPFFFSFVSRHFPFSGLSKKTARFQLRLETSRALCGVACFSDDAQPRWFVFFFFVESVTQQKSQHCNVSSRWNSTDRMRFHHHGSHLDKPTLIPPTALSGACGLFLPYILKRFWIPESDPRLKTHLSRDFFSGGELTDYGHEDQFL